MDKHGEFLFPCITFCFQDRYHFSPILRSSAPTGKVTVRLKDGVASKWRPISMSYVTWCQHVARWRANRTS